MAALDPLNVSSIYQLHIDLRGNRAQIDSLIRCRDLGTIDAIATRSPVRTSTARAALNERTEPQP